MSKRRKRLGNDMELAFEASPPGDLPDGHVHFSGGVVVMASTVDVPDVGLKPALVFRFATPTGGFYPAVVLVADDDQMANLVPLVTEAVTLARQAAS